MRWLLVAWLAVFSLQNTEVLAGLVPDDCVEEAGGASDDACPQNCARCVCCARLQVFVPLLFAPAGYEVPSPPGSLPPLAMSSNPFPLGVLHVPKAS